MKKLLCLIIKLALIIAVLFLDIALSSENVKIRKAIHSGQCYPANEKQLREAIKKLTQRVEKNLARPYQRSVN